jgi:D-aminoacyl-tRNA deacylase
MSRRLSTLFVATKTDVASLNIANNLLNRFPWREIKTSEDKQILVIENEKRSIFLWLVNQSLLSLNHADRLFTAELADIDSQNNINDVIFLSKHAAASGTVSLTVHPIGIPWMKDPGRFGGYPGRCSPPNLHIGALYRSINRHVHKNGLDKTFLTTLEATHHGPFVEVPTCFVEIGSSDAEWSNEEAGKIWSECLGEYFQIPTTTATSIAEAAASATAETLIEEDNNEIIETADQIEEEVNTGLVCVVIGGGHYVPRMNDMVSKIL